jgi:hypothetical protein
MTSTISGLLEELWTWQSGTVRIRKQIVVNPHERLQSMRSHTRRILLHKLITLWLLPISHRRPRRVVVQYTSWLLIGSAHTTHHHDTAWHVHQTCGHNIRLRDDLK